MPSFSLPGTSVGTAEAEGYVLARHLGASRNEAGKRLFEQGMSRSYPKELERMLRTAILRAKALLPATEGSCLLGLEWIWAICGYTERPLLSLNLFCLAHGVNAVCFSHSSILLFNRIRRKAKVSHNPGPAAREAGFIDSW